MVNINLRRSQRDRRHSICAVLFTMLTWMVWGVSMAQAAELSFQRAYLGNLSGQTYATTSLLNADAGSIRFSDGSTQRSFNNTSGTVHYTVNGVPQSEPGTLRARYPNGNVRIDAVAFEGTGGFRLLILGGAYAANSSYGGSSNGIVARLNEYIGETSPDPVQTTLQVNGAATASVPLGNTATVTVTVRLASGAPISGAAVTLAGSPSGASSIAPASVLSDANGVATFSVQGLVTGTVVYRATATASGTITPTNDTVSVTFTGVRSPPQSSAVVPAGTVGSATSIVIAVRDSDGNPVVGAASALGIVVGGTNAGASVSVVTDNGDGTYTASYVPALAGNDSISITLDATPISGSPYSSVVAAQPVAVSLLPAAGGLQQGNEGTSYIQAYTASGGTGPYQFAVGAGALPPGLTLSPAGSITGIPTQAGSYTFTVTVTDANGVRALLTYVLAVEVQARPDPALDRDVINLQAAQVQAAARFANLQNRNVRDRLDQRQRGECRQTSLRDIRLELPHEPRARSTEPMLAEPYRAASIEVGDAAASTSGSPAVAACEDAAAWMGGSLTVGRDRHGLIDLRQTMVGLSGGADRQFTPKLLAGVGVGYGRDRASVTGSSTENRADAVSAFAYGSYRLHGPLLLDIVVGRQKLDFDSRRPVVADGVVAQGSRAGYQSFAATTVGYEFDRERLLLSAYGRIEGSWTKLSAFTESGGGDMNLAFGHQSVEVLAGVVGVAGSHGIPQSWGQLTARWRGEYTHSFGSATRATLGYADETNLPYLLRTPAYRDQFLSTRLGLEAGLASGKTFGIDYGFGSSLDGRTEQTLQLQLDVDF